MPKLKIGLVIDTSLDDNNAGVQQYVLTLGNWLAARGHEVHYLTSETKESDLVNLHSLSRNVRVSFNKNRLSIPLPASRRRIKKLLTAQKFDVLHVQMPYSPLLAGQIINLAPHTTAIIATFHILPYSRLAEHSTRLLAIVERLSLSKLDRVLAVSPPAKEFAAKIFKVDSSVVPNVVETRRFAKAPRKYRRVSELNIVFLGRLVPRKGCQTLLEAVNLLVQRANDLPKFSVTICGAGPLMPSLIKYVGDNGLDKIVKFVGYVSETDKPARLASADIVAYPSSGGESFGIVLVEAMASGNAVVLAGNNPGYASIMGERTELMFDPNGPNELADKLEQYLRDTPLRRAAAAWGKSKAAEFDVKRVGPEIEAIYHQVATAKQSKDN